MPACPSSTELWLLDKQTSRAGISELMVLASSEAWRLSGYICITPWNWVRERCSSHWGGGKCSKAAQFCWHPVAWDCLSWEKQQEVLEPPHLALLLISCECNWNKLIWNKDSWGRKGNLGIIFLAHPGSFWTYETKIALGFAKLLCTYLCTQPTLKSST